MEADFGQALAGFRKSIESGPDDEHRAFILGMLDRWRDHADGAKIYSAIGQASAANNNPAPSPGVFIAWVVRTRLEARRLQRVVVDQSSELEAKGLAQANRHWKDGEVERAAIKRLAVQAVADARKGLLGREQGSAPQKRFTRMWRDTFLENCGRPLDREVAILTEIAFDIEYTADAVRGTQRSTTKRGRDTRRPKKRSGVP
jgi:hypothetical protein